MRGIGEDAEVSEALQIVQQTVTSLRELRRGIEGRDERIRDNENELARLNSELDDLHGANAELQADLADERERVARLVRDVERLQGELHALEGERNNFEDQLRQIVDVIKSSLHGIAHEALEPEPLAAAS